MKRLSRDWKMRLKIIRTVLCLISRRTSVLIQMLSIEEERERDQEWIM